MPKRKKSSVSAGPLRLLVISALLLFGIGEAWLLTRTDAGRLALAKLGLGDPNQATRLVGRQVRAGLAAAGVSPDSVREIVPPTDATLRLRIGLPPDASLIQVNYAVTHALEEGGGTVLSGREGSSRKGEAMLTMRVGLGERETHELYLVRARHLEEETRAQDPARLALIVFGFHDAPAQADSFFALHVPFAVAIVPGVREAETIFRSAHRRGREVVLHAPLEPINYPRIDPGPGTLLVTMKPAKIGSEVRRWLDQGRPVAAVANHMGSLATQDMTVMRAFYRELKRSRVPFLHVNPAAGSVCKALASDMGVAYDEPDEVIDTEARSGGAALERRWKAVLQEAHDRGALTVMVRATPATYAWLSRALDPKRLGDVDVVPLSALVRAPGVAS
jgi:polysaccharide deacetylase 2 family uncharacterized protein YibQ